MKIKKLIDGMGVTEGELQRILLNKKKVTPRILKRYISNKVLRLGVIGDTHLCSTKERLNELHTFYAICKKTGVKTVLHAGDMLAGWKVYRGQENEVRVFGAQNQVQYVVDNYPKVKGIKTYFIDGNHDESWYKLAGVQTGELIGKERKDLIYLGQYQADIILNDIVIRLHHGDGGGAYALSYKGQKMAESIPSGKKPKVLIMGHYHTAFYFWYRNIHILNVGCFEDQTLYLIRKNLNPAIGGWIVELRTGEKRKGEVIACESCWIPFFG